MLSGRLLDWACRDAPPEPLLRPTVRGKAAALVSPNDDALILLHLLKAPRAAPRCCAAVNAAQPISRSPGEKIVRSGRALAEAQGVVDLCRPRARSAPHFLRAPCRRRPEDEAGRACPPSGSSSARSRRSPVEQRHRYVRASMWSDRREARPHAPRASLDTASTSLLPTRRRGCRKSLRPLLDVLPIAPPRSRQRGSC
jgi:hypothetical protein